MTEHDEEQLRAYTKAYSELQEFNAKCWVDGINPALALTPKVLDKAAMNEFDQLWGTLVAAKSLRMSRVIGEVVGGQGLIV